MTAKLLKKDFTILKGYGIRNAVLIVVVALSISFMTEFSSLYYIFPYMVSRYYLSAVLNYEELNHGYLAMMVLPVDRKSIVKGKYLFMITVFTISILAAILFIFIGYTAGFYLYFEIQPHNILMSFFIICFTDGIRMPFILKYGEVKSRIVNYVTQVAALLIYIGLMSLSEELYNKIIPTDFLPSLFVFAGCIGVLAVSYIFSLRALENRDL